MIAVKVILTVGIFALCTTCIPIRAVFVIRYFFFFFILIRGILRLRTISLFWLKWDFGIRYHLYQVGILTLDTSSVTWIKMGFRHETLLYPELWDLGMYYCLSYSDQSWILTWSTIAVVTPPPKATTISVTVIKERLWPQVPCPLLWLWRGFDTRYQQHLQVVVQQTCWGWTLSPLLLQCQLVLQRLSWWMCLVTPPQPQQLPMGWILLSASHQELKRMWKSE